MEDWLSGLVLLMLQLPGCSGMFRVRRMVEAPSIGPLNWPTARAPVALAMSSALRGSMPRSQQVTKAAPKQSPAPVGSTSATLKAGARTSPDLSK
jgi:hypothetical protein